MITSKEMRELEKHCEQVGITREELMENAGRRVYEAIVEKFPDIEKKRIIVVCGPGNNGGDGFVAAKYLKLDGAKVDVLFLGEKYSLSVAAGLNYDCLDELDHDMIVTLSDERYPDINYSSYDIIVDAMLGTGQKGPLMYPYDSIVTHINYSKAFKVSVDIPTGVNADTGESFHNMFVKADIIVTFHDMKPGLGHFKDKVVIADIGIPF